MRSIILMSAFALGAAIYVPGMLNPSDGSSSSPQNTATLKADRKGPKIAKAYKDERGHFYFNAKLNGNHDRVLVDTGATIVAINWTTARRLGIELSQKDFTGKVNTANGQVNVAAAIIDEIKIDRIVVRNVRAAVLPDSALDNTLLGMSFLNKLKRFEIEGSTLKLTR